ncbi:unnamed protein product [Lampetra fluviatilis]
MGDDEDQADGCEADKAEPPHWDDTDGSGTEKILPAEDAQPEEKPVVRQPKSESLYSLLTPLFTQLRDRRARTGEAVGALEELLVAFSLAEEASPGIADRLVSAIVSRVHRHPAKVTISTSSSSSIDSAGSTGTSSSSSRSGSGSGSGPGSTVTGSTGTRRSVVPVRVQSLQLSAQVNPGVEVTNNEVLFPSVPSEQAKNR